MSRSLFTAFGDSGGYDVLAAQLQRVESKPELVDRFVQLLASLAYIGPGVAKLSGSSSPYNDRKGLAENDRTACAKGDPSLILLVAENIVKNAMAVEVLTTAFLKTGHAPLQQKARAGRPPFSLNPSPLHRISFSRRSLMHCLLSSPPTPATSSCCSRSALWLDF